MPPKAKRAVQAAVPHTAAASKNTTIFPVVPAAPVTPVQARPQIFASPSPAEDFSDLSSSDDDQTTRKIPIIFSPIKRRHNAPAINRQSDLEVWDMKDNDILGV